VSFSKYLFLEFCSKFFLILIIRYYNAMLVVKFLMFEIIVLSLQPSPVLQTVFLLAIQLFSTILTFLAIYHKVFEHIYISCKNLVLDVMLLLYFLYTMFTALCRTGTTSICLEKRHI
jgi:hypothetical protein